MRIYVLNTLFLFTLVSNSLLAQKSDKIFELENQIKQLEAQKIILNTSISSMSKNEEFLKKENLELKEVLHALGMYDGDKNEKLLQAVSDSKVLFQDLDSLRVASDDLLKNTKIFSQIARVPDQTKRASLEVSMKKLESVLVGIKVNKQGGDQQGTLNSAKVISIDSESGVIVINVGKRKDCAIGMTFSLSRGDNQLGEAVVVEVRSHIAGLLLTSQVTPGSKIKQGDRAKVKVQR